MSRSFQSWRWLFLGCGLVALALTATAKADDEGDQGKGKKGKDQKAGVIQIDLSKLPPNLAKALQEYALAKALQEYATDSNKPGPPAKGPTAGKSPFTPTNLPPGLAKKPANHPGRVAWIKAYNERQSTPSKGKKKGGSE